jgi:phosphoenolpyruvate carboxykinase (ATP)
MSDVKVSLKKYGIELEPNYILHNPSPPEIYEYANHYEARKTRLSSSGALVAYSGKYMGRTPSDKRIVEDPETKDDIWWGKINMPMDKHVFVINKQRVLDYLNTREWLFVVDAYAGWDPDHQIKVRVVTTRAYHALFMSNMLIRPTHEQLENFGEPDWIVLNGGEFPANIHTEGLTGDASIDLNFETRELVILGTQYAGEIKKGIFTVMNYMMPKLGHLSMHASCNVSMEDPTGVSVFFGLSGTGKTTLSAEPHRYLVGDDEHVWTENGVFNIEGGCYAKCIDLEADKEPEIYNAIRFGSCLENVVIDPITRDVDFTDDSYTVNTRASYPLHYISNALIPAVCGHPTNVIFLTCDSFGVLPPISRLSPEQAMYQFVCGYTAKVAGTEVGISEPQAVFSACFGAPFMVWHPIKYATLLSEKMKKYNTACWLVNTGWTGGPFGVGKRISLKYTRAMIDAIHSGELLEAEYTTTDVFGLSVPNSITGVPTEVLLPENTWADKELFTQKLKHLGGLFIKEFKNYIDEAPQEVIDAGPKI